MTDEYTDAEAPEVGEPSAEPQYDMLAEQSVLGSMMLSRDAVDDVMEVMQPSDFYQPKHELIGKAIATLAVRNHPTDVIAVSSELNRAGMMSRAGGAEYLHELVGIVVTAANAGYHADIVKGMAVRRRLVEKGIRIQAMGNSSEGAPEELVERARAELDEVLVTKRSKLRTIGEGFMDVITSLQEEPTYFSTPWESLDKLIGGVGPGELTVIAARPGSGKSIAVLQLAAHLAHKGMVALSSPEMTEEALQLRLIAQFGPVHMTNLRKHTLNDEDWKRVAEARSRVQGAPIFVDPASGQTLASIRAHARAVARRGPVSGVLVDYLQLIHGTGQSRQEVVADVAEGLKALAKDMNVPVIAAAQLKRAGLGRGRQLPTLDDLRESGSIEQAADLVVLFDRDKEKTPHDLTAIVAKSRNGEQGKFTLNWQAEYARLRDKHWSPTALIEESELA